MHQHRAAALAIVIEGFGTADGQARIVLFHSRASYDGEVPPYRIANAPIRDSRAIWTADDLPAGTYAVIVHHDENANDALDRPVLSLPLEPYGFSNTAFRAVGIPEFGAVSFPLAEQPVSQTIVIRYDPVAAPIVFLRPYRTLVFLSLVLVLPIIVLRALPRLKDGPQISYRKLGRIGLALLLLTTSSAHFLVAAAMMRMLPYRIPLRLPILCGSGALEVVLAVALWCPAWIRQAGIAIAGMLMLYLPANIYAAWTSAPFGGNELGPGYLWVRIPFQLGLVCWALWATGWFDRTTARETRP